MFRFSLRRFALPTPVRVRQYVDHLYPREGKELLPMTDIMPSSNDGMSAAIEFQKMFLESISPLASSSSSNSSINSSSTSTSSGGFPSPRSVNLSAGKSSTTTTTSSAPAAWICTLPGDGLLRNMGHHDTIISPLPSDLLSEVVSTKQKQADENNNNSTSSIVSFSKKKKRLQSLEMTLAIRIDEGTFSSPNPVISQIAPAILLRGSRYPFYAPHTPGFAADLSSAAQLVVGTTGTGNAGNRGIDYSALGFNLEGMGTVLTLGSEPVSVGYIQRFHLADTIATAAEYIRVNFENDGNNASATKNFLREKCGDGTGKGNWWFATGCLARVPASVGKYRANFGLLGDVRVVITE